MMDVTELIFEFVFPACGVILGNFMYFAPYRDLTKAVKCGTLGYLNPTPWAFMMGNCCGWLVYSLLINDYWIYCGTAPGLLLSVWLNMGAAKLQYEGYRTEGVKKSLSGFLENSIKKTEQLILPSQRLESGETESHRRDSLDSWVLNEAKDIGKIVLKVTTQDIQPPAPHETVALIIFSIWVFLVSAITNFDFTPSLRQNVIGIAVNLNLIFFYAAPLSTIFVVLKTGDSGSIHRWTMLLNTLNGTFWAVYGFMLLDPFIVLPNGIGAFLGMIQMFLCVVFPRLSSTEGENKLAFDMEKIKRKREREAGNILGSTLHTMTQSTRGKDETLSMQNLEIESHASSISIEFLEIDLNSPSSDINDDDDDEATVFA